MLRTVINLEPAGDHLHPRALAEIMIANLAHRGGRLSSDYAWRVRSIDSKRKQSVSYGCIADIYNGSAIELLWEVMRAWKAGQEYAIDNHGKVTYLITDHEGYWKRADPNPIELDKITETGKLEPLKK